MTLLDYISPGTWPIDLEGESGLPPCARLIATVAVGIDAEAHAA